MPIMEDQKMLFVMEYESYLPEGFEDISAQHNSEFALSVHCTDLELPCIYDLFCQVDKRTNKVHWIVFKRALYSFPTMRTNRWRISLWNYPVYDLEEAIEKCFQNIVNNLLQNKLVPIWEYDL